jgi:hypothetical protein
VSDRFDEAVRDKGIDRDFNCSIPYFNQICRNAYSKIGSISGTTIILHDTLSEDYKST